MLKRNAGPKRERVPQLVIRAPRCHNLSVAQIRTQDAEAQVGAFYQRLLGAWGRQHWWPAQSRFEVIVGAFLTQNTAWTNVERALVQLRRARVLNPEGIRRTPLPQLEQLVRSAGYFRQKAQRLKNFIAYLDGRHQGSLQRMFATPTAQLRDELLALNGVGPETADSILLYAGGHEIFPVDAYTRRLLERHGLADTRASYEEIRGLCERALRQVSTSGVPSPKPSQAAHPPSRASRLNRSALAQAYNEMHGLIVNVGKNYCLKSRPACERCPLDCFPHVEPARCAEPMPPRTRRI
jgi:endonuclease III related protein